MKSKVLVLSTVVLAGMMLFTACQQAAPTAAPAEAAAPTEAPTAAPTAAPALSGQLQLAGSTSVQPLAEELANAFMAANPDVAIDIQGGGTSVGITSAGDGTVDIGNASREIKDEEMQQYPDLKVFVIAYDGIAIIVNPDVNLTNLTTDQIRSIFSGAVTNFSAVGGPDAPITVVSREEGSGTRGAFEELVMTYKDANGEKKTDSIVSSALLQQSNGQLLTVVATTPNTIGYLSFGFLDNSVKAVSVNDVEPTVANVKNETYPIYRPFIMLTHGDPSPLAKAFLDYIMGPDGQAIVSKDYITIEK